jgi:glycosyltransferase involved in cell wall biosynthesis
MRFGVVWDPKPSASNYRAIHPAMMLQRLGHVSAPLPEEVGAADVDALRTCDAVLVYRRYDGPTREAVAEVRDAGVGIVYDNDDDYTLIPDDHPNRDGLVGAFEATVEVARLAHVMTTTTETVADRYRTHGIDRVRTIPNYVGIGVVAPPRDHEGIVIGWVGGREHAQDAQILRLADTLERVLAKHRDVRVECVGVDLELSERYTHTAFIPFPELSDRLAGWDIGLAPLADLPMNWARSDIKVKEYAARGVPWVASPVGPYVRLGEGQGGRLARDDEWFDVLDRLVRKRRERRKLADAASAWGKRQTIARSARDWEQALLDASEHAGVT